MSGWPPRRMEVSGVGPEFRRYWISEFWGRMAGNRIGGSKENLRPSCCRRLTGVPELRRKIESGYCLDVSRTVRNHQPA